MRLLVCGGRDYINEKRVYEVLCEYKGQVDILIHGKAKGADLIADTWALLNKVPVMPFQAEWGRFGKRAGHIRNSLMLVEGKPDLVIAFPGGFGTADMVNQARRCGIQVIEIDDV